MAAAFLAMTIAYVIVFQVARDETLSTSFGAGIRNIIAILPIALFIRFCIRGPLSILSWPTKLLAHIALACFVSLAWYTLVLFLRHWSLDWMQSGVALTPFSQKASFWHLYQGLVVYGALVAANYAFLLRAEIDEVRGKMTEPAPRMEAGSGTIFVKSDHEFIRLEHQDLVLISANNETVTIHTRHGKFRSIRRMKDLEDQLGKFGFIRIHRSHLINLAMVRSAEPTGDGRLSVHMLNNRSLISSRAGAKRFKEAISV
ncbi:MAG: LytTR family DNA-binding domain-containing protein [Pseudomonadota bacterium]